jgi:hypothetical protein
MASHNIALGAETGIAVFWRRVLFAHLIEHEHFLVKTGSGQAQEKAEKNGVFAGVPMHANEFLLTDVLRNRFGLGEGGYIGRWVMMRETTR